MIVASPRRFSLICSSNIPRNPNRAQNTVFLQSIFPIPANLATNYNLPFLGIYAQNLQTRYEFYLLSLDDMIAMMTSRLDLSRVPDRPKPSSPWSPGAAAAGACASSSSFPRRIPNQLELSLSIMQEETERYVAFPPKLPFVSRGIFAHAGEVIDFLKVDNYAHREELACRYHSVVSSI